MLGYACACANLVRLSGDSEGTYEMDLFRSNFQSIKDLKKDGVDQSDIDALKKTIKYLEEIVNHDDYDNKTFYPKVELRYHFRSKERASFGNQHDYFHKGYKSTFSFTYDEISDPDYGIQKIEKEYNDYIIEKENRKNGATAE